MYHYRTGYKFCLKVFTDHYRFSFSKRKIDYYGDNYETRNYYNIY